ncbi:MAG TPA: DUF364 domain-containing protein [Syntrophales bacterium]|nr:DUF364 domain-containing protein [Syntrophales bacterium]
MVLDETVRKVEDLYEDRLNGITVERLVMGIFFTGVKLSTGLCGISYTPTAEIHKKSGCLQIAPSSVRELLFKGAPVSELLAVPDEDLFFRTIRIVVLNALSALFLTRDLYCIVEDCDALDMIDPASMHKICMVGAIRPFVDRFKTLDHVELQIVEQKIESLRTDEMRYFVPSTEAASALSLCDTAVITGAAVANGTMDTLLGYTGKATHVIVAGPTAGFLPDALFRRNVSVLSTVLVDRPDMTLDFLAEGMGAYQLFRNRCIKKINIVNDVRDHSGGRGPSPDQRA